MTRPVTITFEGRRLEAIEGRSIAAVLHAAGVRTLSWSSRYRRPRGYRCGTGACPGCTVRVDGLAGVEACLTPVHGGEVVERIRPPAAWLPADRLSRFVRAGFQLAPWLGRTAVWRAVERILANLAGVTPLPAQGAARVGGYAERAADLLVVGGGRHGLATATEAALAGRAVLLVDRDHEPGGRLLSQPGGRQFAAGLAEAARAAGVEILPSSTDLGRFDDGVHAVAGPAGLTVVTAREVRYATGTYDREVTLPDGDRPGVMLAGGAARLLVREGVLPGRRAVVIEVPPHGDEIAGILAEAGVEIVGRCAPDVVEAIDGRPAVERVRFAGRTVPCDLVVIAAGRIPADEAARGDDRLP